MSPFSKGEIRIPMRSFAAKNAFQSLKFLTIIGVVFKRSINVSRRPVLSVQNKIRASLFSRNSRIKYLRLVSGSEMRWLILIFGNGSAEKVNDDFVFCSVILICEKSLNAALNSSGVKNISVGGQSGRRISKRSCS